MRETMCAVIRRLWMPVGLTDWVIVVVDDDMDSWRSVVRTCGQDPQSCFVLFVLTHNSLPTGDTSCSSSPLWTLYSSCKFCRQQCYRQIATPTHIVCPIAASLHPLEDSSWTHSPVVGLCEVLSLPHMF